MKQISPDTIEAVSAKTHEQWIETNRRRGVASSRSQSGEELLRPYSQLSESAKEIDRAIVRVVLNAFAETEEQGGKQQTRHGGGSA